jgi:AcrR family transcriptional regulator
MERNGDTPTRTRPRLTRELVLETAIRLADEGGIESLTMRKLAGELGVEAMSLYNHVANKGDLVDAIVDVVLSEVALPPATQDWDTAIRAYAIYAYEAFRRHPWACHLSMTLSSSQSPRVARLRYMEWLLGRLRDAGFSPDLTYDAYHAIDSHILGFTLWQLEHVGSVQEIAGQDDVAAFVARFVAQLRREGYQHLADHAEQHVELGGSKGNREFEFGLDLVLDGLKRARG